MLAQDAFAPARLKELNLSENTFNRKPVLPVFFISVKFYSTVKLLHGYN